jgi:polysaccharide biosynthesis protein PslH
MKLMPSPTKKILMVTPVCPYGHHGGHATRVRMIYETLSQKHEVWVLFAHFKAGLPTQIDRDIIGEHLLEYPKSINALRRFWFHLVRVIRYHRTRPMRSRKIHPDKLCPFLLPTLVKQVCRKTAYDVVLVEYVFFSKVFGKLSNEIHKVIDTHDLFGDRDARVPKGTNLLWPWCIANLDIRDEANALNRSDAVIAIQNDEGHLLKERGVRKVEVVSLLPNVVDQEIWRANLIIDRDPVLIYFGSDWGPNVQGVEWFIEKVLPLIQKSIPSIRMKLIGGICKSISPSASVECLGYVEDVKKEVIQADLVVIPVFYGTGLNIKLVETLQWGIPFVATHHAFRGLNLDGNEGFSITDESDKFSSEVIRLLQNEEERMELSKSVLRYKTKVEKESLKAINRAIGF